MAATNEPEITFSQASEDASLSFLCRAHNGPVGRAKDLFIVRIGSSKFSICRDCLRCLEGRSRMAHNGNFDYTKKRGK
jgi:hypothetical protein